MKIIVQRIAVDTMGNCPHCGHVESSYDDWENGGYSIATQQRLWKCRHCGGLVSPDQPRG